MYRYLFLFLLVAPATQSFQRIQHKNVELLQITQESREMRERSRSLTDIDELRALAEKAAVLSRKVSKMKVISPVEEDAHRISLDRDQLARFAQEDQALELAKRNLGAVMCSPRSFETRSRSITPKISDEPVKIGSAPVTPSCHMPKVIREQSAPDLFDGAGVSTNDEMGEVTKKWDAIISRHNSFRSESREATERWNAVIRNHHQLRMRKASDQSPQ